MLIEAEDYEAAVEVAKQQIENGAQIIDINMDEGMLNSEEAMQTFLEADGHEAALARKVVGGYISYAFHRVGEVTETIDGIDRIMGQGFNWAPPSVLVDTMGGAAAVLGAGLIAARLKLPVNLSVIVPTAENMPDGLAIRPADVLTMASGKTVEVLNTDAEGRLILADALWYAARGKPDYIIDAATLTGACVVALGHHFAGLMGNSGRVIDAIRVTEYV